MKDAIIAGVISGFMSPLILAWLRHKIIWKAQKRDEIKMNAFIDTLTALSSLETDALDTELQSNKKSYKGRTRIVEFRPETIIVKERARGMVRAFFSKETFEKVDKAMREEVSIENVPNIDFEESRILAISALASELGINYNLWKAITRHFTGPKKPGR
ncbi:MAG: hypothetical protein PHP23_04605 [Desulfobacterales bacterium]|nr:hypothetical protein [Desulfobacterales bacterium]MDD4071675.1 hypothetical protein [Desulfobacterales bacterium]MDD4393586.1 hypothetical protein [Desulfobacterales bacterium]